MNISRKRTKCSFMRQLYVAVIFFIARVKMAFRIFNQYQQNGHRLIISSKTFHRLARISRSQPPCSVTLILFLFDFKDETVKQQGYYYIFYP